MNKNFVLFLILALAFLGHKYFVTKREQQALFYTDQIRIKTKELEILMKRFDSVNKHEKEKQSITLEYLNTFLTIPLSKRELSVLRQLSKGSSNHQIADALFVSINTIKSHLIKIHEKLDVKNRIQAVQKMNDIEIAMR